MWFQNHYLISIIVGSLMTLFFFLLNERKKEKSSYGLMFLISTVITFIALQIPQIEFEQIELTEIDLGDKINTGTPRF
jgi:TctA family transporter